MSDVALNRALHHCASIVVFDKTFPARLRKVMVLSETLFAEILNRVVVSVSQEIVKLLVLSMIFQFVH